MEHRYAALVRGSRAIFPRGFLWFVPAWYAVAAYLFTTRERPAAWYGNAALATVAMSTVILLVVLATVRHNAFLADDSGISLGLRAAAARRRHTRRRRQIRHLPWPEIQRVVIATRPYGARVIVLVRPDAPAARNGSRVLLLIATALTLVIPLCYPFRTPGLLIARRRPPRYKIPLWDVVPAEAGRALAGMAPASVQVTVVPTLRARVLGWLRRAVRPIGDAPA